MNKFNKPVLNNAEESFRWLMNSDVIGVRRKKVFLHNFKNMCHHSDVGNLFAHHYAKPDGVVKVERESMLIDTDSNSYMEDAIAIELIPERNGVRRAFLMIPLHDYISDKFKAELHVYYHSVGKVVYPVKNDNLHNTMLLALATY